MDVTIGLAFIAGLASFLSPCVISLVPVYIGYLTGRSASGSSSSEQVTHWETLSHGAAFVLGFSVVFVLLGLAISVIGNLLYDARDWLAKIGGVIVILFGVHMTGLLRLPFLEYDLRPRTNLEKNRSYLSSFLLGVFFSAGWSPCVGPVLGTILLIALNEGSISQGVQLLVSYSAGMAIPFLVAAFALSWVAKLIRKQKKVLRIIEFAMGILMIIVGIMLFLGTFETLARFGSFINIDL